MEVWVYLTIAAATATIVLMFGSARDAQRRRDSVRLAAVDRNLRLVMDHLGITEPEPDQPEVVAHLEQGRKIQAVKVYRDATGVDLAAAKAAVERIARDRGLPT